VNIIQREVDKKLIKGYMKKFPVTAILGPRQCGKTTLARSFLYDHFFDLENPRDLLKLENPQLTFEDLTGMIVIDERVTVVPLPLLAEENSLL
jgi:predicted AAA+ superfamily ATPase